MGRRKLLTYEQHGELRRLYAEGGITMAELGERFGVGASTAFRYISREPSAAPVVVRREEFIDALGPDSSGRPTAPAKLTRGEVFKEFGVSGLQRFGGTVQEDYLQEWSALSRMVPLVKRMMDNPTISAILFAVEMTIRSAEWSVQPASEEKADTDAAEFLESCVNDMSHTFDEHVVQALTMIPFGFSPFEIVYKRRRGPDKEPASSLDDGLIGWRKLAFRSPDTLAPGDEWVFDEAGGVQGLNQTAPPSNQKVTIPIEKMLLYRTTSAKNNPQGRALALDTLIPTPDGWQTMADLVVESRVFDENGVIRNVVAKSQVWKDRPAYRLTFTDGSSIVADENHRWLTQSLSERARRLPGKLRTTVEIANSLKTARGASNHGISWTKPPRNPKQHLLVKPYVLGLWLGDGNSKSSVIYCHSDDLEETTHKIIAQGYSITRTDRNGDTNGGLIAVKGLVTQLRAIGVYSNKHIPEEYTLASPEQRLELLCGLMDSDGYVNKDGQCIFTSTTKQLVDGAAQLVRSLGGRATICKKRINHGNFLDSWDVKYTPDGFKPFWLERKRERTINERSRKYHYIIRAEQLNVPVETVCIEVDSPSGLFLAGESMIPTHNSALRGAYIPWYFAKNLAEVEGISAERMGAGIPVIYLGKGTTKSGASSDFAGAKKAVRDLAADEQAGIVFSHPKQTSDGEGMLFELVSPPSRGIVDFHQVIERYNQQMAQTLLAQFIFLGLTQRGTQALAVRSTDFFTQAIDGWTESIAQVFNLFAVPRLFRINSSSFPGIADYPKIVIGPLGTFDVTAFVEAVKTATDAGALTRTIDIERAVRQALELPEPDNLEELQKEAKAAGEQAKADALARLQQGKKGDTDLGEDDEDDAGGKAKGKADSKPDLGDDDEDDAEDAALRLRVMEMLSSMRQTIDRLSARPDKDEEPSWLRRQYERLVERFTGRQIDDVHPANVQVDVHVPKQDPPVTNVVSAPQIDVHVPEQAPADVHVDVHVPEQIPLAPPAITVTPKIDVHVPAVPVTVKVQSPDEVVETETTIERDPETMLIQRTLRQSRRQGK